MQQVIDTLDLLVLEMIAARKKLAFACEVRDTHEGWHGGDPSAQAIAEEAYESVTTMPDRIDQFLVELERTLGTTEGGT